MKYKDIVKILFSPENESFIPDGVAYSEAVCEKKCGKLWDSFFLYAVTDMRKKAIGPFAKISVDVSSGRMVDYCEYENPREFSLENKYDDETVIKALENYEALYPAFREAYQQELCGETTKELLLQVMKNIRIFANSDMFDIYNQLFAETFKFMVDNSI